MFLSVAVFEYSDHQPPEDEALEGMRVNPLVPDAFGARHRIIGDEGLVQTYGPGRVRALHVADAGWRPRWSAGGTANGAIEPAVEDLMKRALPAVASHGDVCIQVLTKANVSKRLIIRGDDERFERRSRFFVYSGEDGGGGDGRPGASTLGPWWVPDHLDLKATPLSDDDRALLRDGVQPDDFELGDILIQDRTGADWHIADEHGRPERMLMEFQLGLDRRQTVRLLYANAAAEGAFPAAEDGAAAPSNAEKLGRVGGQSFRAPETGSDNDDARKGENIDKLVKVLEALAQVEPGAVAGAHFPVGLTSMIDDFVRAEQRDIGYVLGDGSAINATGREFLTEFNHFLEIVGAASRLAAEGIDLHQRLAARRADPNRDDGSAAGTIDRKRIQETIRNVVEAASKLSGKIVAAGGSIGSSVHTAAGSAAGVAASGVAAGVGSLAGAVISAVAATRNFRKFGRAIGRRRSLNEILQDVGAAALDPRLKGALELLVLKTTRRMRLTFATGSAASAAAVGGVIAFAAIFVVGTAATPVGWALLGAAALVGIGIGGYLLYRRLTRERRREERREDARFAGIATIEEAAAAVLELARQGNEIAKTVLEIFTIPPVGLARVPVTQVVEQFERHLNR